MKVNSKQSIRRVLVRSPFCQRVIKFSVHQNQLVRVQKLLNYLNYLLKSDKGLYLTNPNVGNRAIIKCIALIWFFSNCFPNISEYHNTKQKHKNTGIFLLLN